MLESHKKGEAGRLEGKRTTEVFYFLFFIIVVSLGEVVPAFYTYTQTDIYIYLVGIFRRFCSVVCRFLFYEGR